MCQHIETCPFPSLAQLGCLTFSRCFCVSGSEIKTRTRFASCCSAPSLLELPRDIRARKWNRAVVHARCQSLRSPTTAVSDGLPRCGAPDGYPLPRRTAGRLGQHGALAQCLDLVLAIPFCLHNQLNKDLRLRQPSMYHVILLNIAFMRFNITRC